MADAAQGIRGIKTLPDEAADLTAAEVVWVAAEVVVGRHIYNEIPDGSINGSNVTFTLAAAPSTGTLQLYRNGNRLQSGASNDYTVSGATITMNQAPESGDVLIADYRDP